MLKQTYQYTTAFTQNFNNLDQNNSITAI